MYSIWSFFTLHKSFSYLVLVTLVAFGSYALVTIPKESAPEVQIPIAIVSVALPGASAVDIEKLITNKVETALNNSLEDVKKITSSSQEGFSSVVVEFLPSANIDDSVRDVKDEIDKVNPELPEDATEPIVSDVNFVNQPIITFAIGADLPDAELVALADAVEDEIKKVEGVSDVTIGGYRARETQVIVRKEALETYGLRLVDIIGGIARANNTFPVGNILVDSIAYNVQFEGDLNDPAEVANITIFLQGGQPVYVRDVATVVDGLEEARSISRISLDSEPSSSALSIQVFKRSGGDITKITDEVKKTLDTLKSDGGILSDATTLVVFDNGKELKNDLVSLGSSGAQTVVLVMISLFMVIGWREALIAGSAIPLSFLLAFIALEASGNTLNFVSLFALILAVGVLVDSAIVIVEGINRNMRLNPLMSKKDASLAAIKEFHGPITSGTLTTVAVFVPLFFISGVTGEFIASIPFTIIFVLIASLIIAVAIVPLFASLFLTRHEPSKLELIQAEYQEKVERWYKQKLESILGNPKRERIVIWGIVAMFFVAMTLPVLGLVKVEFFPAGDSDFVVIELELLEGSPLSQTDIEMRKLEEILYEYSIIESFVMTAGESSAFSGSQSVSAGAKFANAFVTLKKDRPVTSQEFADDLRAKTAAIGTAEVRISQVENGPPTGTPVLIKFLGDDLATLEETVQKAATILENTEGSADVVTSAKNDGTQYVVEVDPAKASALGLDASLISQTLRTAVSGVKATSIVSNDEDIDVVVKLNLNTNYMDAHDTDRTTIDSLGQISIQTPNGPVLLASVLEVSLAKNNTVIQHENLKRVVSVGSQLESGANLVEVVAAFEEKVKEELVLPQGVTMVIGGENEENNQAFTEMFYALIVGLVLMLAILVFEFSSYRHALYVLSVTPLALIGIMIGLMVTGKALSFPTLMGFIALMGIVVNNSIILIDTMNAMRKTDPAKPIRDVVLEGSASRLRPISLTTITTVIGMVPLTYADALWSPLAWAIIFGLSFSVVLTLLLVPILYGRKPGELER